MAIYLNIIFDALKAALLFPVHRIMYSPLYAHLKQCNLILKYSTYLGWFKLIALTLMQIPCQLTERQEGELGSIRFLTTLGDFSF
jgi:hypothetical protein